MDALKKLGVGPSKDLPILPLENEPFSIRLEPCVLRKDRKEGPLSGQIHPDSSSRDSHYCPASMLAPKKRDEDFVVEKASSYDNTIDASNIVELSVDGGSEDQS